MFCDEPPDFLLVSLNRLLRWGNEGVKAKYCTVCICVAPVIPGWKLLYMMTQKVESSKSIFTQD